MARAALKLATNPKVILVSTLATVLTCCTLWLAGQGPMFTGDRAESAADDVLLVAAADDTATATDRSRAKGPLSEAQRIARLQRTIEADRKQLTALEQQSVDPDSEYRQADAEFAAIDARWSARRREIEYLQRANKSREAEQLVAESEALRQDWQDAKERFDLAINRRKAMREKAAALEQKIQQDAGALEVLVNGELQGPPPPPPADSQDEMLTAERDAGRETNSPAAAAAAAQQQPRADAGGLTSISPLAKLSPLGTAATSLARERETADATKPSNDRLARAMKDAETRRAAASAAEDRARSLNERVEALRKNISIEQQLLDIARAKADQSHTAREKLTKDLQQALQENPAALEDVWEKIADADKRYTEARTEVRQVLDRLDSLHDELSGLQDEQLSALHVARQKVDEADQAQGELDRLQNPFTLRNIIQWFLDHGPKLLTILLSTLVLALVVKLSGRQIAQLVARSGSRGTAHDRENRAITLVGVFRNTASIALVTGGLLMALDEVGIPIGPLMGGAAVLGLAIAFGAQNLIRDYFSGFMVLLEDQYGIGDVVKIGDVAGNVEKITLRMTVLRDMEGAVHFIPHGSITRVTNMTHGWSRAVVEIGVAYKEDADRVMQTLLEIGRELRKDPTYGPVILDGPEMLGLDNLADSAVVLKFFLKTQPLQRWFVRRELLRRIKRRFDELGIEIPFPQRTIHHRYDNGEMDPEKIGVLRPAGGHAGM